MQLQPEGRTGRLGIVRLEYPGRPSRCARRCRFSAPASTCSSADGSTARVALLSRGRPSGDSAVGDLLCQFRLTNQGVRSILTGMDTRTSRESRSDDPAMATRLLALHRLAERVRSEPVAVGPGKWLVVAADRRRLGRHPPIVHAKYNKESSDYRIRCARRCFTPGPSI